MAKNYGGSNPLKGGSKSAKSNGSKAKTNTGKSSGLTMSNDMRSDMTKAPSNKNPYPKGMC